MTFRAFIYRTIKANIQKYYLFLLSTVFSMSVLFVFANLWFTDGFIENTNPQMHSLMYIAAIITIIFSVFIINYVNWYMLKERAKSFSVLLSYGMTNKGLALMIAEETLLIYSVSLVFAFIAGGVFSKLFFMISTKLLMIDNIKYELTYQSFIATALVFAIIFAAVLLVLLIQIFRADIITISKLKSNPEMKDKSKAFVGIIGILLIVGSLTALYLHNGNSAKKITEWILGAAVVSLTGAYLSIRHFSSLIYHKLKANEKGYFAHILESSEFAMGYRQNVKTLFVLTLLTLGIVLFIPVTYTLNHEAYRMTEKENPHDLYFEDFEAEKIMDKQEADAFLTQHGAVEFHGIILPFLYMEAPGMIINNWRGSNWIPVIDEKEYNRCFDSDIDVASGETKQIIFESRVGHNFDYFKNDNLILKNSANSYSLHNVKTSYEKIMNRYVFTQGVLLVVDHADYSRFKQEATDLEQGNLYLYMFKDWKKSRDICTAFSKDFYHRFEKTAKSNRQVYKELEQRYGYAHMTVRSKIDYFDATKLQGSFSLFIMSFVSILFAFCILITYYFKVFLEASKDMERFSKLDGIGFLTKEKRRLIKTRIRLIMFVPTVLGILLGVGWSFALNLNMLMEVELSNLIILRNAIIFGGIFCVIILAEYIVLTKSYFRRLGIS